MPGREERAKDTRATLVDRARELFGRRGYAAVGTEEIVRAAGVTRGALYHHFADKRDLFRAVHEELEAQIVARIAADMAGVSDPREVLATGMRSFLDACLEPAGMRIGVLDAPTVLGWSAWREIGARHGLGLLVAGLQGAMDAGALRRTEVRPLAHLLFGALSEAALLVADSDDREAARDEVEVTLLVLLDGLAA